MFVVPNGYVCCVQDVNGCGEEDLREITVRLRRGKGEGGGGKAFCHALTARLCHSDGLRSSSCCQQRRTTPVSPAP